MGQRRIAASRSASRRSPRSAATRSGAVAMAYPGTQRLASDSQFFILRRAAPELDGKYAVFGHVLKGQDVVAKLQRGDVLKRAYLKDEAAKS